VVVTVQAGVTTATLKKQNHILPGMLPWLGGLLCLPLWFKRKRLGGIAVFLLTAALLVAVGGCGGSSKPAPVTSILTVTATGTGGVAPATTTLTLTVQ